jgi:hypothetical protein
MLDETLQKVGDVIKGLEISSGTAKLNLLRQRPIPQH